jgi:hypothetical protein
MALLNKKKILPFVLFFIVANPALFKLVRKVLGGWVASAEGLPTTAGLLVHSLVFVLLSTFLWRKIYGKTSSYTMESAEILEDK